MEKTKLSLMAQWCEGTVSGESDITGVSIDSRSCKPGDLFVALLGENTDGHKYIASAAANGASAALVQKPVDTGIPVVMVQDCQRAFGAMMAAYRRTLPAKVIAITGSVGKTTTKEMTHLVLSKKYITAKSEKNHNNELGLPLTLASINKDSQLAVLELGMNHFGEMSRLTAIAQPDTAVIVNIGTMHIENLGSREGILKAKLEILEGLKPGGKAIFNGDEPLLWELRDKLPCQVIWFGAENPQCQVRAENIHLSEMGSSFDAILFDQRVHVTLPVEGQHNVMDALAALAVGCEYGVELETMAEALAEFQNTGMRQKTYEKAGFTIIEDCYNAGPESTAASLEVLAARSCPGKKIAVLGSMLELGDHSRAAHERIGRLAAEKADVLLAYGQDMQWAMEAAQAAGGQAYGFTDRQQAADKLAELANRGDEILFKGSRGMAVEKIMECFFTNIGEN